MTDPTTTLYGAGDLIPPLPKPMPDLTKSRRAVALRIAEVIDSEWPDLAFSAGWDINEATDIIEPLIPMTAAEAEAEMEAMRDESDDDDEAICEPVVNPTLQAFKDAVGCGKVPIIEAIKAATELIHSLREQVTVARESRDAAENAAKEAVQAEMAELRKQHADLKTSLHAFASCVLTVETNNTDEWMDWIAGTVNDVCEMLGTGDRFQYDGRERLRRVK